jgi:Lon protease-like protein
MSASAETLPSRFPIFPLRGALLLPGGNLPLNIFEPRYLAMVRDAMRTDKVIGMVQPRDRAEPPGLFETGCAGRIVNFAETEDGRFLIVLNGICRFDIGRELEVGTPYRQIEADYARWRADLSPTDPPAELRVRLMAALDRYFHVQEIKADLRQLGEAPLFSLVTALAMICPFEATEKQALLEAPTVAAQAELLATLMEMAAAAGELRSGARH